MGNILYGVILRIFNSFHKTANIAIVGLDGAGKTMVLYCLKLGESITSTVPTIGFNVEELIHGKVTIQAWDLGGQHKLRELWTHYLEDATGLIFVVDSVDKARFGEARDELNRIVSNKKLPQFPILILANKQDVKNYAASPEEVHAALECDNLYRDIHTVGCSALNNERIVLGLDWLVQHID